MKENWHLSEPEIWLVKKTCCGNMRTGLKKLIGRNFQHMVGQNCLFISSVQWKSHAVLIGRISVVFENLKSYSIKQAICASLILCEEN